MTYEIHFFGGPWDGLVWNRADPIDSYCHTARSYDVNNKTGLSDYYVANSPGESCFQVVSADVIKIDLHWRPNTNFKDTYKWTR